MKQLKIAGYETLCIDRPQSDRHIVMLHGYGANCHDLAPLAHELSTRQEYNWWFVNAPKKLALYPGMNMDMRAWFDIDAALLQQSMMTGDFKNMRTVFGPDVEKAASGLTAWIKEAGIDWTKTIVGGFSQGAMVATELMLSQPTLAKGLLIYSGALANNRWNEMMKTKTSVPVFQSHGDDDQIIAVEAAHGLAHLFQENKFSDFHFEVFQGGHEIPHLVLKKSQVFLDRL